MKRFIWATQFSYLGQLQEDKKGEREREPEHAEKTRFGTASVRTDVAQGVAECCRAPQKKNDKSDAYE